MSGFEIFFYNVVAPICVGFIAGAVAGRAWLVLDETDEGKQS